MLFFWTFYSSKNPEKKKKSTVFNIDNNQKCFLNSKSSLFLQESDTEDWSNDAENSIIELY